MAKTVDLEDQSTLDALDMPITDVAIVPSDALNNMEMLRYYKSEKRVPVMIATPEGHPGDYAEWVQINGVGFIIRADEIVMVPESVKAVLDNKKAQEALVRNQVKAARAKMQYTSINQVPEYIN